MAPKMTLETFRPDLPRLYGSQWICCRSCCGVEDELDVLHLLISHCDCCVLSLGLKFDGQYCGDKKKTGKLL